MFSRRSPRPTSRSRQASAAAPAPEQTSLTSLDALADHLQAVRTAAAATIAVPCWSSWKTGIFMRSRSFVSMYEALRRLDVLEVDAAEGRLERGDDVDELVGVGLVDLDVEHVDAGELLEQAALAFHHRLAGQRADVAQAQHGGAVGDDGDQVAARGVGSAASSGSSRDLQAGGGHARASRPAQVALGGHVLGRQDHDLPRRRETMIVERCLDEELIGVWFGLACPGSWCVEVYFLAHGPSLWHSWRYVFPRLSEARCLFASDNQLSVPSVAASSACRGR